MDRTPLIFAVITAASVAAALVSAHADRSLWYTIAKSVASAGFVGVALTMGALHATWSRFVLAGLVLGAIGDLVLGTRAKPALPVGMACFATAYAAYTVGFTMRGTSVLAAAIGAVTAAMIGSTAWVVLTPWVPSKLRIPVSIYIALASTMLAAGMAAGITHRASTLVGGVVLVALSDGAVGAERFGKQSFIIKTVGLPAYYLGQILIALSLAG